MEILFVDRKNYLEEIIIKSNNKYILHFADNFQTALKILKNNEIDVCIINADLISLNGFDLLSRIKKNYPKIIRVLITDHQEKNFSLRTFNLAHQHYKSPLTEQILKEKIEPATILKSLIQNEKTLTKLNSEDGIPTLPEIYYKVEKEINLPDVSIQRIANLISKDLSLTTKILQLANSAYFGISAKIVDILQAINILGLNVIKSIIVYTKVFTNLEKKRELKEIIETIWNHSILVSNISHKIIYHFTKEKELAEQAYIAGILHDIGKVILLNIEHDYEKLLKLFNINAEIDDDKIKKEYGATHSEIGAYTLAIWGFHKSVVDAVLLHHSFHTINYLSLSNVISISNRLSNIEGIDDLLYQSFYTKEDLIEFINSQELFTK
ncbi:MAG: response regulator [Melioribacter sp.]|nr:response regulator [Melioribacter sp.]